MSTPSINRSVSPGLIADYSENPALHESFAQMQELRFTFTNRGMGSEDAIVNKSLILNQDSLFSQLFQLLGVHSYCERCATTFAFFEEPPGWGAMASTVFSYEILPSIAGIAARFYHFSQEEFCSTMINFYKELEKETEMVNYSGFIQLLQGLAPLSKNLVDARSFMARLLPG
jgi:hypothetical protein